MFKEHLVTQFLACEHVASKLIFMTL